jgi:hypothetical protein
MAAIDLLIANLYLQNKHFHYKIVGRNVLDIYNNFILSYYIEEKTQGYFLLNNEKWLLLIF